MTASASLALVADIGGTHARFALADIRTRELQLFKKFKVSEFTSLEAAAASYLSLAGCRPARGCFAIAGPVGGEVLRLTNANWSFTRATVGEATGVSELSFINDFEAQARSLPLLTEGDFHKVGGERAEPQATKAVVGPGTGLGVAALVWTSAGWSPVSGEGGHAGFAAEHAEEFDIFTRLQREFGHVSAERVISGPGLSTIYGILCELSGLSPVRIPGADIVQRANGGADQLAARTIELFAEWLGRFAGDIALMFGARGGVFIAGGIPPRILNFLVTGKFRSGFEAKGRLTDYVRRIPAYVMVVEDAGLRGAATLVASAE